MSKIGLVALMAGVALAQDGDGGERHPANRPAGLPEGAQGGRKGGKAAASAPRDTGALRSVAVKRVKTAQPKAEAPLPALPAEESTELTRVYNMTGTPPVLRTYALADVKLVNGSRWSRAAATQAYSDAETSSGIGAGWRRDRGLKPVL